MSKAIENYGSCKKTNNKGKKKRTSGYYKESLAIDCRLSEKGSVSQGKVHSSSPSASGNWSMITSLLIIS